MNTVRILSGMTLRDVQEATRALESLLNGVVTPDDRTQDELTQRVTFGLTEPGRRSGFVVAGTLQVNLSTQQRRS